MVLPTDETLRPGEMLRRATVEDLGPGVAVRIWHETLQRWAPGWWCELVEVDRGGRLRLRDLKSGEELDRSICDPLAVTYLHPRPEGLRALGTIERVEEAAHLDALREEVEALDPPSMSESDIARFLREDLCWRGRNRCSYHDLRDEFELRDAVVRRLGEELHRRGGPGLMREVAGSLGTPRPLDTLWSGIDGWPE